MTDGGHIAQEDLALFVMHGCSEEESEAVRAHVKECALCRAELEDVSANLAMVAMSVEQHPLPEGARQRFMEKIAATSTSTERVAMGRATQAQVIPIRSEPKVRRPLVWVPWTLAAALALFAVALTIANRSLQRELREEEHQLADVMEANSHAQAVLDVLTAPKAQHVMLTASKAAPAPSARAVYLASSGGLILEASNMGPLPEHKAYELWVIPANGKAPIPAGLFWPDAAGSASLVLPKLPAGVEAKAFGVTVEDAEGSPWPTSKIILAGGA
jgi:hypothetical protein